MTVCGMEMVEQVGGGGEQSRRSTWEGKSKLRQ